VNLRKGCHQIDGGSKISSELIRKSDPKKEEALINPTFSTASARLRTFSQMQKRVWSLG
jgi:hypothetical protein